MELTVGQALFSVLDHTSVIVVRAPQSEVSVECGAVEMVADSGKVDPTKFGMTNSIESRDPTLLGKRYVGLGGDLELLCTKPGTFPLSANGVQLEMKQARPLPSSD